jgi:hypothetical protein
MKPLIAKLNRMPKRVAWLRNVVIAQAAGDGRLKP